MEQLNKEVVMINIVVPVENDEQAFILKKSINALFDSNEQARIDFRILKMPMTKSNGTPV